MILKPQSTRQTLRKGPKRATQHQESPQKHSEMKAKPSQEQEKVIKKTPNGQEQYKNNQ